MSAVKFIYKVSWFQSKRHLKSHTSLYYEKAEHTEWVFKTEDWFKDLVRVEYIQVAETHYAYKQALNNSKIHTFKYNFMMDIDDDELGVNVEINGIYEWDSEEELRANWDALMEKVKERGAVCYEILKTNGYGESEVVCSEVVCKKLI